MPGALLFLVYALAVARITRLVTSDRITEAPRERFVSWAWRRSWLPAARIEAEGGNCTNGAWGCADAWSREARVNGAEPPLLAYLATCPWCVSIYVGAVAAPLVWFWGSSPWLAIPALALAFSQATGVLASKGE